MIHLHLDDSNAVQAMLATIAHIEGGVPHAVAKSINTTLRDVKKAAIREAQNTYTARASDLSRKTKLETATRSKLAGVMHIADTRGMSLVNFRARPNRPGARPKEGASVQVLKSGGRKNPRKHGQKAFVTVGRNGNTLMFVRTKQGPGGLEALYGPHPIQALSRESALRSVEDSARRSLGVNLQTEIDAMLAKSAKGGRR